MFKVRVNVFELGRGLVASETMATMILRSAYRSRYDAELVVRERDAFEVVGNVSA